MQGGVGLVVGEQVPPGIGDEGGIGVKRLDKTPQRVVDLRRADRLGGQGEACHGEQQTSVMHRTRPMIVPGPGHTWPPRRHPR